MSTKALDTVITDFNFDCLSSYIKEKGLTKYKTDETPKNRTPAKYVWDVQVDDLFAIHDSFGIVPIQTAKDDDRDAPMVVFAVQVNKDLTSRTCRKKQFDLARSCIRWCFGDLKHYGDIRQGIFVFHDEKGNFRFSLVTAGRNIAEKDFNIFRRQTFFVEPAKPNKTFRQRMEMPWDSLEAIKKAFSVETLTKDFYKELFAWYDRACNDKDIEFPNDVETDKDNQDCKREHLIRLITRLMFVWFIKHKGLVPEQLFDKDALKGILKSFNPAKDDNYYRAILQNLFFATLNSKIKDRAFAADGTRKENKEHFDIKTLYRYKDEFAISDKDVLAMFREIPFLNGGLFECLDRGKDYFDGFSRNPKWVAHIPNKYFFDDKDEKAIGLIPLLNRYNFTVDENAPNDTDVALDPELLGKVFENLLGAYNPETKETARKQSGSFYTPREIVNYMVDESLIAHLTTKCGVEAGETIRKLFTDATRPADNDLCAKLDKAMVTAKILDPACGSGAFPMGILLRMVELLRVLRNVPESDTLYDIKLEMIENCIYGNDIQCIAVQISKLRFFISLVCEQTRTNDADRNYGINPLPNLDTKFVAADSLIGIPKEGRDALDLCTGNIAQLKTELFEIRHKHFGAKTYGEKKELRKQDKQKRDEIKKSVKQASKPTTVIDAIADKLDSWNPYDQNTSAPFSDSEWMFDVKNGFDIVIGNPPYGAQLSKEVSRWVRMSYETAAGELDSYMLFVERSSGLLKNLGVLAFIVPDTWMTLINGTKFRRWLLEKHAISEMVLLNGLVFESAVVEAMLLFLSCDAPSGSSQTRIRTAEKNQRVLDVTLLPVVSRQNQLMWLDSSDAQVRAFSTPLLGALIRKIKDQSVRLDKLVDYRAGCKPYEEGKGVPPQSKKILKTKPFTGTVNHGKGWMPLLRGNDVHRYEVKSKKLEWILYGEWLAAPRSMDVFSGERIVIQAIRNPSLTSRIVACLTDKTFIARINVYSLLQMPGSAIDLSVLLAILNSRLMNWFLMKDYGLHTYVITGVRALPIKESVFLEPNAKELRKRCSCILAAKKSDPRANTATLEAEIDRLVYQLYGLTAAEIAIVENAGKTPDGGQAVVAGGVAAEDTEPEAGGEDTRRAAPGTRRRGRKVEKDDGSDAMD